MVGFFCGVYMSGCKVLIGITGGIAAYKTAQLVRLLRKANIEVRVVMTQGGSAFISALTLQALSGNPVHQSLLDADSEAGMGHIELAKWADLVVVAPATADFIARFCHGLADDLLTTLCLATEAPVALAPAMNQAMWRNPRTQRNLDSLRDDIQAAKVLVWGPDAGAQACGDVGPGRMLEPEDLCARIQAWLDQNGSPASEQKQLNLAGRRLVITAGPTREAIDPVRYISNYSSGKMGYALAAAAAQAGARVTLISGPVALTCPAGVDRVEVTSALEMHDATHAAIATECDIFIAAAAVADYRPRQSADQKMKKQEGQGLVIELVQNPDIVASVAASKRAQLVVGFAAETTNVERYAADKLQRKGLDMVIANDVSNPSIGFNSDENAVTVITKADCTSLPRQEKSVLALALLQFMQVALDKKQAGGAVVPITEI